MSQEKPCGKLKLLPSSGRGGNATIRFTPTTAPQGSVVWSKIANGRVKRIQRMPSDALELVVDTTKRESAAVYRVQTDDCTLSLNVGGR